MTTQVQKQIAMLTDQQNHIAVSLSRQADAINAQAHMLVDLITRHEVLALCLERMAAVEEITALFVQEVLSPEQAQAYSNMMQALKEDPYLNLDEKPAEKPPAQVVKVKGAHEQSQARGVD